MKLQLEIDSDDMKKLEKGGVIIRGAIVNGEEVVIEITGG